MKKEKQKKEIILPPVNIGTIKVKIKGTTPLLMDKLPEDVKKKILEKQTGAAKGNKKLVRNLEQETKNAIHTTNSGKVGFPSFGFKKGMMEATSFVGDLKFSKKLICGLKIMNGEDGLIPIKFKNRDILEHNIGSNTKFTPRFHDWSCELDIMFDQNNISVQDIVTLINYAGFYVGIGAWRPKGGGGGSGEFGMYGVVMS